MRATAERIARAILLPSLIAATSQGCRVSHLALSFRMKLRNTPSALLIFLSSARQPAFTTLASERRTRAAARDDTTPASLRGAFDLS